MTNTLKIHDTLMRLNQVSKDTKRQKSFVVLNTKLNKKFLTALQKYNIIRRFKAINRSQLLVDISSNWKYPYSFTKLASGSSQALFNIYSTNKGIIEITSARLNNVERNGNKIYICSIIIKYHAYSKNSR